MQSFVVYGFASSDKFCLCAFFQDRDASTNTLAKSKSNIDSSKMAPGMQILYKNKCKPTIDVNFIKSMAKTIKVNRASKAEADVVDEKE
jgi:hypothetical protein